MPPGTTTTCRLANSSRCARTGDCTPPRRPPNAAAPASGQRAAGRYSAVGPMGTGISEGSALAGAASASASAATASISWNATANVCNTLASSPGNQGSRMSAAPTSRTSTQPHEIALPRLSDSMEEATVVEWLVGVGDEVNVGDEIAMIETDKATVPLEADGSGTLTEIVVAAGEAAALGAVLARLGGAPAPARAKASPVARRIAREHGIDLHTVAGNGPQGRIVKADIEALIARLRAPEREVATAGGLENGDVETARVGAAGEAPVDGAAAR